MNVGVVTPRYPPNASGGGEVSARLLAERLAANERVAEVVVLSFDGRGAERRGGVEVRRFRALSSAVTEWQNVRAYRFLREAFPELDVVHAYNMELHPAVGLLSDRLDVPSVATLNSYHFFPKAVANASPGTVERLYELVGHPTTGRIMLSLIKRVDRMVAISSAVRDVYVERGFDADDVEVVPNMLDPAFEPPDSADPGDDRNATEVLYVGELADRKGVSHLIEALSSLPSTFHLRIVGEGDRREQLEALVARRGLQERVAFAGWIPYEEVPEQYARADVFVHPGVWPEPFGRTVLEAMQSGLPVVATEVGGPADVVQQAELRCPPGDPEALAVAIQRATEDTAAIGERNRRYVADTFAPEAVTDRIVELYERVRADC